LLAKGNTLLSIRTLPNQFYIGGRAQDQVNYPVHLGMIINQDNTDKVFITHILQQKEVPRTDEVQTTGAGM
jgi:hypothetical protein